MVVVNAFDNNSRGNFFLDCVRQKTEDGPSLLAMGRPFMACCLTVDYFSGRSVTVMADLLLPWISITKPSAASAVSAIMP